MSASSNFFFSVIFFYGLHFCRVFYEEKKVIKLFSDKMKRIKDIGEKHEISSKNYK